MTQWSKLQYDSIAEGILARACLVIKLECQLYWYNSEWESRYLWPNSLNSCSCLCSRSIQLLSSGVLKLIFHLFIYFFWGGHTNLAIQASPMTFYYCIEIIEPVSHLVTFSVN